MLGKNGCVMVHYDGSVDKYVDATDFMDWLVNAYGSESNEWAIRLDRDRLIDERTAQ